MMSAVAGVSAAVVSAISGVGRRDVVVMPLGPRGVPAGRGAVPIRRTAVPVRRITVPGARGPVSVRRVRTGRSRGTGHEGGAGGSRGRADRRGGHGHGRRCGRPRGPASTHDGRTLAGSGPMPGARAPMGRRRPGHHRARRGCTASAAVGYEGPAVARSPASAMRGCARDGPAAFVTVLRRCVECCRCRSARRRGRGSLRSGADRERDEPKHHDGGNPGEAETKGGRAQQSGERPSGCHGGCRTRCCAGRRRIRGGGLRIRGDCGRLVAARRSLGPRMCALGAGSAGRSLPHDPAHHRTGPR